MAADVLSRARRDEIRTSLYSLEARNLSPHGPIVGEAHGVTQLPQEMSDDRMASEGVA